MVLGIGFWLLIMVARASRMACHGRMQAAQSQPDTTGRTEDLSPEVEADGDRDA